MFMWPDKATVPNTISNSQQRDDDREGGKRAREWEKHTTIVQRAFAFSRPANTALVLPPFSRNEKMREKSRKFDNCGCRERTQMLAMLPYSRVISPSLNLYVSKLIRRTMRRARAIAEEQPAAAWVQSAIKCCFAQDILAKWPNLNL